MQCITWFTPAKSNEAPSANLFSEESAMIYLPGFYLPNYDDACSKHDETKLKKIKSIKKQRGIPRDH